MGRVSEIQKFTAIARYDYRSIAIAALLMGLLLSACGSMPNRTADATIEVLSLPESEIPEAHLLDVRLAVFDPGELAKFENATLGLSEETRKAEAFYIPVHLRNVLQQSGSWGAVRVVPEVSPGAEVMITGSILSSNSEILKLNIDVHDATGRRWFNKTYEGVVDGERYVESAKYRLEVFQNVYYRIANDLSSYRETLDTDKIEQIRLLAELRFAEALAPNIFGQFVVEADRSGNFKVVKMSAQDDVMLERARRIRERDYQLVDTLDDYYDGLYREMYDVYTSWRQARIMEMEMIREVEAEERGEKWTGAMMILAAIAAAELAGDYRHNTGVTTLVDMTVTIGAQKFFDANQIAQEAEINRAALEELGDSFSADVSPTVLRVEGDAIELSGSVDAKYAQWRDVLERLYEVESRETSDAIYDTNQ